MAYRKFRADGIFDGTQIIPGKVLIATESGVIIDLVDLPEAGDDIEEIDGMLCPGFINTHCHTELSHMKGTLPKYTGMVPFLKRVMFERQAENEVKQEAIQRAIDDMYRGGIVAVGDTCNTDDSLNAKAGSQQVYFHNFIEVSGFVPDTAAIRMNQSLQKANSFVDYFSPEQVSVTPHAAYSVSQKLFSLIADQAPRIISIHNQESQAEEDFIRNKAGEMLSLFDSIGVNIDFFEPQHTGSLAYSLQLLPRQSQVILVHNCLTTQHDIDLLQEQSSRDHTSFFFCLCPNANLYIGNPLPQLSILTKSGIPVCIGTDSLAGNEELSVLAELQTLQRHFPFLTTEVLLQWATSNGAKALGIDNRFGSFAKGTKPGILQLRNIPEEQLSHAEVNRII